MNATRNKLPCDLILSNICKGIRQTVTLSRLMNFFDELLNITSDYRDRFRNFAMVHGTV